MRTKLATLAIACLVALPLVAASSAPTPSVDEIADVSTVPEATVMAEAPLSTESETPSVEEQAWGRCNSNAYCVDWCLANYNSPYGFCSPTGYCYCVI